MTEQLRFGGEFEVRDMRHKEKFMIDDAYLNGYAKLCGVYATGVYVSLCRHANKEQNCFPSLDRIAEELAISKTQTRRAIKLLVKYNIICVKRLGKKLNNRYYLIDKSEWSGRTLTISPQDTHLCPDRTLHSKDTHSKDTHKKEPCLILKDWNERQNSPIPFFKPENIVNKYGAEKIEKLIKQYGQINGGFSQFLKALKNE